MLRRAEHLWLATGPFKLNFRVLNAVTPTFRASVGERRRSIALGLHSGFSCRNKRNIDVPFLNMMPSAHGQDVKSVRRAAAAAQIRYGLLFSLGDEPVSKNA